MGKWINNFKIVIGEGLKERFLIIFKEVQEGEKLVSVCWSVQEGIWKEMGRDVEERGVFQIQKVVQLGCQGRKIYDKFNGVN